MKKKEENHNNEDTDSLSLDNENKKQDFSDKENEIPGKTISEIQEIDYKDKYLRLLAETENVRRRIQKEKSETIRFAVENTVSEFLPTLDNFENALKFSNNASEDVKNWAKGFQMMLTQFRDILHNHGIVAFHSEGNMFDPHFHEAMEIVETNESPDGTILEEYAKGYKSGNRTIRPAKVKVAKNISSEEEIEKDQNL
jgi:molecular chaperone GrpE